MTAIRDILRIILGCVICFTIVNTIHFQFLPVRVVLYDALVDVTVALVITGILTLAIRPLRSRLSSIERVQAIIIGGLLCTLYAFVGPTIIDRSLSVYILEKLDQRGGGVRADAMPRIFVDEYMKEYRLTDIRITEQLNSGTVRIADGCLYLTALGKATIAFTQFYRAHILPKKREIMGSYTDVLTDPFRNSVQDVDYKCRPPIS